MNQVDHIIRPGAYASNSVTRSCAYATNLVTRPGAYASNTVTWGRILKSI